MTQLAEELELHLPALTARARLYTEAQKLLRGAGMDARRAEAGFVRAVRADAALLAALAQEFLQRVRADMAWQPASEKDGAKGHQSSDNHLRAAQAPSASLPGEGLASLDTRRPNAQPRQPHEGGEGHLSIDTHLIDAPPPSPHGSSEGHANLDNHIANADAAAAPPLPKELSATAIAARGAAAKAVAISVFDTHRLSNGENIGDVYWGSLPRLRLASARDAALLRLLIDMGHADPQRKVREIISEDQLQRAIQKSAEVADAM